MTAEQAEAQLLLMEGTGRVTRDAGSGLVVEPCPVEPCTGGGWHYSRNGTPLSRREAREVLAATDELQEYAEGKALAALAGGEG